MACDAEVVLHHLPGKQVTGPVVCIVGLSSEEWGGYLSPFLNSL